MANPTAAAEVLTSQARRKKAGPWTVIRTFARREPVGFVCALIILAFIVIALAGPLIRPYPENALIGDRLESPNAKFLLGTDHLGRDVLSRVITGSMVSLLVGFFAVGIGLLSGAALGITSAYIGGKFDLYVQRLVDAKQAMPGLILAMMLVAVLGTGMWAAVIAIGILGIGNGSRVVRSSVLSVKQEMYVEAAKAIGASTPRIMLHHILPQVVPLLIVLASIAIPGAVSTEASLSFLGLGVQPPAPSWGNMLSGPARANMTVAPWLILAPGIALSVVVLAYNMLGDSLRDVLDPRLRGSRKS